MLGPVEKCMAESSASSSVQSSSVEEDFCVTGVARAAEVVGVELVAGSVRMTVESVGGADVMGVMSG
jgi:hypothetical protein